MPKAIAIVANLFLLAVGLAMVLLWARSHHAVDIVKRERVSVEARADGSGGFDVPMLSVGVRSMEGMLNVSVSRARWEAKDRAGAENFSRGRAGVAWTYYQGVPRDFADRRTPDSRPVLGVAIDRYDTSRLTRRTLWLPTLYAAAPFFVLPAITPARWCRRAARRSRALCVSCGYDLRESPKRCPECGEAHEGSIAMRSAGRAALVAMGVALVQGIALGVLVLRVKESPERQHGTAKATPGTGVTDQVTPTQFPKRLRDAYAQLDRGRAYVFVGRGAFIESLNMAEVEVCVFAAGRWRGQIFAVRPGERIGKPVGGIDFSTRYRFKGARLAGGDWWIVMQADGGEVEERSAAADKRDPRRELLALLRGYRGMDIERALSANVGGDGR